MVGGRGRKGGRREKDEREGRVRENEHKESRREKWQGKGRDKRKDGAMFERGKIINKQTRKKESGKEKKEIFQIKRRPIHRQMILRRQ